MALPETCGDPVIWVRPDSIGYFGPDLGVALHATSVAVLTVGVDGPILLEAPGRPATTARSVYAPARAAHRIIAPESRILLLFLDPAGPRAADTAAAMREFAGPFGLGHRREQALSTACLAGADPAAVVRAAAGAAVAADPRITALALAIRSDPGREYRAPATAAGLGLSTSHFLRLFAQSTGTTFRRYQQWARIRQVVGGLAAGHDLTRSAIEAGFASPSHFSDTFRETFGTSATAVLGAGVRFDIGA